MNTKEIAELLIEAALDYRAQALACYAGILPDRYKDEMVEKAERFEASAVKVEAMSCEIDATVKGLEDNFTPSELYWHEALDRSQVAMDHFSEYVEKHPAVLNDLELKAAAEKVTRVMYDFYQLVGVKYVAFQDGRGEG